VRILSLAAGAAGMYCGSCLRDNALAAELVARGHEVTLVPLYTPLLTDERNVTRPEVLFGGINVYLQHYSSLFRRLPPVISRWLDRPGLISLFADRAVSTDAKLLGDLTVSMLEGRDGVLHKEFEKLVDWVRAEPAPDIVNLPNSLLISLARPLREALGRPICCTLSGEELFLGNLHEPYRSRALALIRKQAAEEVSRFIAVSEYSARFMSGYLGVPRERIAVVPLGVNVHEFDGKRPARHADDPFRVGYFARVAPEKGLHVLVDAFLRFRRNEPSARARLDVAGYLAAADKPYLAAAQDQIARAGLSADFTYHGIVDRAQKIAFLQSIDVLSVPATYDEPKGLFLLEALASGTAVLQPRRGSFTEVVEKTGGGLLVAPDDADALAAGLAGLWRDRGLTARLGQQGQTGVRGHYTVQQSAARLVATYSDVVAGRSETAAAPRVAAH
jgi:glycosyltransferase involved in cell wall biosynthesis